MRETERGAAKLHNPFTISGLKIEQKSYDVVMMNGDMRRKESEKQLNLMSDAHYFCSDK